MARAASDYTRLPGRRRGALAVFTLWIARDHLLLVERHGYTEAYRRFYFRDIQAVVLRRTRAYAAWAVAWTLLALPPAAAAVAGAWGAAFWSVVAVLCAGLLALHLGRGPTCACHLTTALQTAQLPPVRLRPALRTLARIRVEAERAQAGAAATPGARTAVSAVPAGTIAAEPPPLPQPHAARFHGLLTALFFADATVSGLQLGWDSGWLDGAALAILAAQLLAAVGAIVRQRRSRLGRGLRLFAGWSVAYVGVQVATSWVLAMVGGFRAAAAGSAFPQRLPQADIVISIALILALAMAGWGSGLLLRARRAEARG